MLSLMLFISNSTYLNVERVSIQSEISVLKILSDRRVGTHRFNAHFSFFFALFFCTRIPVPVDGV